MSFRKINFSRFRNLECESVKTEASEIYLIGENGQGKTNFLEAVYILCYGASFRTKNDSLLIKNGEKETALFAEYTDEYGLSNTIAFSAGSSKKIIKYNGKTVKDRRQIINNIPCIIFSHEDLNFVKGAPEKRRQFFNQTLSLYDGIFIDLLRKYSRIVKQRNAALKERNSETAELYESSMAGFGLEIQKKRNALINELNPEFSKLFEAVSKSGLELKLAYKPSWKADKAEEIIKLLAAGRKNDLMEGLSKTGPHRDDFIFTADGRNFSSYASTGQLRLMSLILRVLQARFFQKKTGRKPVILLDDVLLEMDFEKRKTFLELLPEYEQAFFTFLPDENTEVYKKNGTKFYTVNMGNIYEQH